MNKVHKLIILGLFTLLASACQKNEPKKQSTKEGEAKTVRQNFVADLDYQSIKEVDENNQPLSPLADKELRSVLTKKPSLFVPELILEKASDKVFWSLEGLGTLEELTETTTIPALGANIGNKVWFDINNKNLKFYISTSEQTVGKKTCVAIGGTANGSTISVNPNANIQAILNDEQDTGRDIPIMTDVLPFKQIFAEANASNTVRENQKLKVRGSLVGINIVNKLDKDITLNQIIFEAGGALSYEGNFDLNQATADNKATFTEMSDHLTLDNLALTCTATNTSTTVAKENAPLFYVWGMPKANTEPLKLKLVFTLELGGVVREITTTTINVPANFAEHTAYRRTLVLEANKLFGQKTALTYVSDVAVNGSANNFAPDINQHSNNEVTNYNNQVGFHQLSDWIRNDLFYNPNLTAYKLASKEEWASIINNNDSNGFIIDNFLGDSNKTTITEGTAKISSEVINSPSSDYKKINGVTYALRFKGTKWQSVWRYSWKDNTPSGMVIKCIPLKNISNINLDDIATDEFFNDNIFTVTEKLLPTYGHIPGGNTIQGQENGFYWSSTDTWHLYFNKNNGAGLGNQYHPNWHRMTIRPFYKNMP